MFRGIVSVAMMSMRTFLRDRGALFWGIAFPVMLMGLIGSVFGEGDIVLQTSIVGRSDQPIAQGLYEALESVPVLSIVDEEEHEDEALAALRKGERSLVVVLPEADALQAMMQRTQAVSTGADPSSPLKIHVYYDEGRAQVAQAGIAIVQQVVEEFDRRLTMRPELLTVTTSGMAAEQMGIFDFLLPGVVAMTIMQTGLMGVTWVISSYREQRLLKRILATPFPPIAFLTGMVARFTLTNIVQASIIVIIGVGIFKAKVMGSFSALFLLALLGSVTFLAIGFAISTLSKTAESANNLGSAVSFPMMFLSGTFWPREMIPDVLQPVIGFLPLTPLVEAMRGVATQADTLGMHLNGILYLLGWIIVSFAVATWRFRWE